MGKTMQKEKIMRKNEEISLTIHDLHANGQGVGKGETGITVFVPEALPGDMLRVKILKVKKHYAYGKIIEVIKPSAERLPKRDSRICKVAGQCGGCQFQRFDYPAQLTFKEKLVKDALTRIGNCEAPPMASILGMDKPYHYRNKAQFPVGREKGKGREGDGDKERNLVKRGGKGKEKSKEKGRPLIGFYASRSHRIVPISECNIQHPACNEVLNAVQNILERYPISIYDEETHQELLRHVVVRVGFNTGEVMVIFVINGNMLPHAKDIKAAFPSYTLVINENTARTNVILGPVFTTLQGSGYIHEEIGHVRYRISPGAFFQVNPVQTKVLYDAVAAHLSGGEKVIDAYSGIGGIALHIAGKAKNVIGIESVEAAVNDGIHNAALNGIENVRFLCGAAEELVPDLLNQGEGPDVLILDPPRKGCDERLLEAVSAARIPKIIYVSCDPATLARDVRQLVEAGYRLMNVQPVDLFPMTGHVEAIVLLQRHDS